MPNEAFNIKYRTCLKCSEAFLSKGAYNRICPSCAKKQPRLDNCRRSRKIAKASSAPCDNQ